MSNQQQRLLSAAQIDQVIALAHEAGKAILAVYNAPGGFDVEHKIDSSFLTEADVQSNQILVSELQDIAGKWPVLSEENTEQHAADIRQAWQTLWMIDPLDGTKDFVHRTGEFAINIALIDGQDVHWGLVYSPVLQTAWHGGRQYGAFLRHDDDGIDRQIRAHVPAARPLRTLISRSHHGGAEEAILRIIDESGYGPAQSLQHGSSIKYCKIAQGAADFMPRLHPCMEWDTAAPQGVLEGAGGTILTTGNEQLTYNARKTLRNGNLVALADTQLPWQVWLGDAQQ